VAQILNILENFDLREIHHANPARMHHIVAEAMKLAFADRAHWLGDPDFVQVPTGLLDKEYASGLAARIESDRAIQVKSHGLPPDRDAKSFGGHTTHVATADQQGNWVALTTTINTTFGSKVVVPGTGVLLNNQMDDFAIAPGVPNAFG
jgi:gamma-glutamyltranspeptidase/glutathione hydrolase